MSNISLANKVGQSFNDLYAERPVWAIASMPTSGINSPVYSTYGERSPYNPISVEYTGLAKSKARNFQDEMVNSSYMFYGSSSAQMSSNSFSPTQGFYSITSNAQTGCLANFDAFDNGNYGFYEATSFDARGTIGRSGVVVGESNWRQCYDLMLTENGRIFKDEIGGGFTSATGGNKPFITVGSIGGNFVSSGGWGFGQISYNRNTKRLLVVQPTGGSNSNYLTYRLHFFDLQNKIDRNTTIDQIKTWMIAAAASASRYRYVNVQFNAASCYYGSTNTYDSAYSKFVLCDNDEVWMFKSTDSANTGGYANTLFRVNRSGGGTWLTDTYTATAVINFSGTTCYGGNSGMHLSPKHMNSDDNSVIALYQHYYYYGCGYSVAYVSTKDASSTSFNYSQSTDTSTNYTIAPMGGPNFVFCNSGYNNDGYGPRIGFVNNETLAGTAIIPSFAGYAWPAYASSTNYGGNLILKVQPTTEWK